MGGAAKNWRAKKIKLMQNAQESKTIYQIYRVPMYLDWCTTIYLKY